MADQGQKSNTIDDLIRELTQKDSSSGQPVGQKPTTSAPLPPRPTPSSPSPVPPRPVTQNIPPAPPRPQSVPPPMPPSNLPNIPPRPTPPPISSSSTPPAAGLPPQGPKGEYQSSIRTMADDISSLKQGQKPQGVPMQKTIEQQEAPRPAVPKPVSTTPFRPSNVELGGTEKSSALPGLPKIAGGPKPSMTPPPSSKPAIDIPPASSGISHSALPLNKILGTVLVLVVIGAGLYWYFGIRQPIDEVVYTPTPEITPTPQEITLDGIFAVPLASVSFSGTSNPFQQFNSELNSIPLNAGEFNKITGAEKGLSGMTVAEFLDRFLVNYPAELRSTLGDSVVLAYGQNEAFDSKGQIIIGAPVQKRLVLVAEIDDFAVASSSLISWQTSMTNDLAALFGFDKAKPASSKFLSNTYRGSAISYINFPYPDRTIDYSLFTAGNKNYLIISSSRESMFGAMDAIQNKTQ